MGATINITTDDGFELSAYLAQPTGTARGAILVIQEIFGVNIHIREVCDGFAADGYVACAPALFDRLERGVELGYTAEDIGVGRDLARGRTDFDRAVADVVATAEHMRTLLPAGAKIGCTGYCWGGVVTSALAVHGSPIACAVSYYGTGTVGQIGSPLASPLLCHYGELDTSVPAEDIAKITAAWSLAEVYVYPAQHGFNCDHRAQFDAEAAVLARGRTMAFFAEHVG